MLKWAYIRLVWKNHLTFAIFSMIFITLFQFLLLYLIRTFDTAAMLSAILDQMPPMMKAFLQDSFFSMLNYDGAAAFGFNHPIVLILLVILAITIPVSHITGELENGTLELILADPVKRSSLLNSLWFAGLTTLFVIIAVALAGSYTSIILFHTLTRKIFFRLLIICLNLWLLMSFIFTYTIFITVFSKVGTKTGNISAAITFFFYLLYFLSQLWDKLAFTRPFNIFSYYEPQKVMLGKSNSGSDLGILAVLILVFFTISRKQFSVRDIP